MKKISSNLFMKIQSLKKKNVILFLIISVVYIQATAQEGYQSFFGTNTTKYHIFTPLTCYMDGTDSINKNLLTCGFTYEYIITKDDTISVSDTIYYQVWNDSWDIFVDLFIREDTTKGQLFCYIEELNKEYLICDMNLNLGDTFLLPKYDYEGIDQRRKYYYREEGAITIVDSIAYINNKKVIYLSAIQESYYYNYSYQDLFLLTFTEGIGPTYGPFGYINTSEERLSVLLCVEKDDTLTHVTSPQLGCYQSGTPIQEMNTNPIRLYPNPVHDKLHVELEHNLFSGGIVYLVDPIGQIVYTGTLTSNITIIPISHLSNGMYVLQYIHNNKIFQSKFIIK